MKSTLLVGAGCLSLIVSVYAAQEGARPASGSAVGANWPSHNLDLHNTRFSPLTQIDTTNVGKLTLTWSSEQMGTAEQTPVVVDGVMYLGLGSKVVALREPWSMASSFAAQLAEVKRWTNRVREHASRAR